MNRNPSALLGMTNSYNSNSSAQFHAIESSIPFIEKGIDVLDLIPSSFPIIIADYGCAHGSNSIYAMKLILDYIKQTKQINRSFLIIHNDLSSNDWSTVFNLLNDDQTYFGLANGRSFYEQCLPSNSLSIAYSSTSIHWLSRLPCNVFNHCMPRFAEQAQLIEFEKQAENDYRLFLENRSRELISGGIIILSILCADDNGRTQTHHATDHLYKCAQLISLTEEELLGYTIPMYHRTYKECLNQDIFKQCSLQLITSAFETVQSKFDQELQQEKINVEQFVDKHIGYQRSWGESILRQTLETNPNRSKEEIDQLLDQFWSIYKNGLKDNPREYPIGYYQTYLVLKKF